MFSLRASHDRYEGLCAAAVTGEIKPDELTELKEHMNTCADCRHFVSEASQLAAQLIPEYGEKHAPVKVPDGITERFIVRANYEGIPLHIPIGRAKHSIQSRARMFILAAGLAAASATAVWLAFNAYLHMKKPSQMIQVTTPTSNIAAVTPNGREQQLVRGNSDLQEKLKNLQEQLKSLAREIKSNQEVLERANLRSSTLSARLLAVERDNAELRQNLADRDAQLAQIKTELDNAQSVKDASKIASQVEEAELNKFREQVARLTTDLQQSEALSATATQARDLITARRLHIVDVDDTDETGRTQRPFGRIFYTEGKALVFYAYDLGDQRKLNAKIHFYVWGSTEGSKKSVKSLGIFHSDNAGEGRWVLNFDDPKVLAQIDCVFVTAESDKKAATQPTGKQILFASLGRKANHP